MDEIIQLSGPVQEAAHAGDRVVPGADSRAEGPAEPVYRGPQGYPHRAAGDRQDPEHRGIQPH